MMMSTTTLPTRNEAWGYFGTLQRAGADPMQSWTAASAMIAAETEASAEAVRDFLDSRHGRHFADDVASEIAGAAPRTSRKRSRRRSHAGRAGGSAAAPSATRASRPGFPT
jgi:hypothetical protein